MIRTPEEQHLHNIISIYVNPLEEDIKVLKNKINWDQNDMINELIEKIPLANRFKVFLEMEYLNIIIEPDTCCSNEQMNEADKWATNVTAHLISKLQQWENDGKPT